VYRFTVEVRDADAHLLAHLPGWEIAVAPDAITPEGTDFDTVFGARLGPMTIRHAGTYAAIVRLEDADTEARMPFHVGQA
jgi:hypothetical protein